MASKSKKSKPPSDRLIRELWALLLLLLAILLALSFVPLTLVGSAGTNLFPTGNMVGSVGAAISSIAWRFFGVVAFLLPALPAVWAAAVLERVRPEPTARLTMLLGGLLLLIPIGIFVLSRPLDYVPPSAGWVGEAFGSPLAAVLGWVGSAIFVLFLIAAVCVATLGWNPLRAVARGGVIAWVRSQAAATSLGQRLEDRKAARQLAAATRTVASADQTQTLEAPTEPARAREAESLREDPKTRKPSRRQAKVEEVFEDTGDPTSGDVPATNLLTAAPLRDEARDNRELDNLGQVLIEKLATFRIEGEIVGRTSGPVVTQFEVEPAPGVKVARIANLDADLALAMRAPSVRIVAPIPGKGAVGVEVPNPEPQMVHFREVLESPAFRSSKARLPLALGKDIAGKPYVADLARMPHLLIAGATGSGKSVCINTIITSLIYRHSPQSLRLLMVDPKMVELSVYNDLPHLRHPVVTDNSEAAGVLKWAVLEMESRYGLLSANNVRNIDDFNRRIADGILIKSPEPVGEEGDPERYVYKGGPLPYIVLIIDELADLMMTVQGEVEKPLALLAQKARAIGIHLILATQRPSVNVITGLIKANFPSRIAFRVASKVDSRTILDQNGADNLLGNGDMLFLPPGQSDPMRLQGAYISTEDSEKLMGWYRDLAAAAKADAEGADDGAKEDDILELVRAAENSMDDSDAAEEALLDRDKLFREAADICIQNDGGSTSLLQRRLRIGYGRAARIVDQLHHAGILGPADGSKPRDVLVDFVQLEQMFPDE